MFEVGMKVECIDSYCSRLTVGNYYKILRMVDDCIYILNDVGLENGYLVRRFREVQEPEMKYNIGDRVKIISDSACENNLLVNMGDIYTVISYNPDSIYPVVVGPGGMALALHEVELSTKEPVTDIQALVKEYNRIGNDPGATKTDDDLKVCIARCFEFLGYKIVLDEKIIQYTYKVEKV